MVVAGVMGIEGDTMALCLESVAAVVGRDSHRVRVRIGCLSGILAGGTGDGGAEGNRTPDLLIANEALSQLSYSPIAGFAVRSVTGAARRP